MKKTLLLSLFVLFGLSIAHAQIKVTGVVTDDATGEPLPFVTVALKGTTTTTSTTDNGSFTITVPSSTSILQFSFLGYETLEMPANTGQALTVKMKSSSTTLEEVVVTGITVTDKRLFTGAADRIDAEKVMLGGVADISRSLEGRSAGVTIQNVSGSFGTAPKIRIRGATSIFGNSKPLWVVDGVIVEDVADISGDQLSSGDAVTLIGNAIAGLNADDIETFDVLKDGSATSIYGARAMSGVIVITTKKGKAGTARFNYTGEFTSRLIPSYRNFNIMNSQDQMEIYQELYNKGSLNYAGVINASRSGVYGYMDRLIDQYNPQNGFGLQHTPESMNALLRNAEMRNTDWFDELFSTDIMMNHSISFSQGSEKASTYVSMSVLTDPGWHKQSNVNRYTFNANAQYKLLDNLTISVLGNGSYRKQFAPGSVGEATDAVNGTVSRNFDINPYSYALNTSRSMGPDNAYIRNYSYFNILQELEQNYLELDVIDTKFQTELKWTIMPGLDISTLGAVKYQATMQQHYIKDQSNQARAYRAMGTSTIMNSNPWLYNDPDITNGEPVSVLPAGGFYNVDEYKMISYDFRTTLRYKKLFDDIHTVDFYSGVEVNSLNRSSNWFQGVGMQYENGEIANFDYRIFKKYNQQNSNYFGLSNTFNRSAAFFATVNYSYRSKYSINGTVRYEGSNRLGKARSARWLPTWNVSGAWNVHEENFFKAAQKYISHLKLRASYSLTAQPGPSYVSNAEAIISNYTPWRYGASHRETGLQIAELENSELTYEKQHEVDFGVDLGLFNNRVNIVFDWYKRDMYDLIGLESTMGVGGVINKYANSADMESHGMEFTVSTRNITTKNFSWVTDFTYSYNTSVITNLKTQGFLLSMLTGRGYPREGYTRSAMFSIPFAGLSHEGLPTFMWADDLKIQPGNYGSLNFQERNKLDFLKYEGPTEPTTTGGFGNTFNYKGFRLNVFMTYSFGNKIRLDPMFKNSYSDMDASTKDFNDRWSVPGEELITTIPVIPSPLQNHQYASMNMAYNAYNYSDVRVADGGFIRMKEISLTYDFPRSIVQSLKMQNLSLKLQATNLFLLYADRKLNGQDPEFFRSGGVAVPMSQQFTMTVRVGF